MFSKVIANHLWSLLHQGSVSAFNIIDQNRIEKMFDDIGMPYCKEVMYPGEGLGFYVYKPNCTKKP